MEKATFQDLIAKKLQRENDKLKITEVVVPSMGKALVFKKPSDDVLVNLIDDIGDGKDMHAIVGAYKRLIYMTCASLQDQKLHSELDVVDPYDVVDVLFDVTDVMQIGAALSDFVGLSSVGEDVKN